MWILEIKLIFKVDIYGKMVLRIDQTERFEKLLFAGMNFRDFLLEKLIIRVSRGIKLKL